jgi:TolB-like protein
VRYVLEGSVRKARQRLFLRLQPSSTSRRGQVLHNTRRETFCIEASVLRLRGHKQ